MKPTIEKLKIVVAYAIKYEHQANMFTGRSSIAAVPTGKVHIFAMETVAGFTEPSRFAFCGKTRAEIGEQTKDSDKRPDHLPMCQECEAEWKQHPDSPWRTWEQSAKP